MRLTDLFVKRPVLAIVVNLVILIAGLQSIRALSVRQYPRSDIAVVRVSTVYIGANPDLVRGFITTPLERVIASADGIDYMESSSAYGVSTITVHLRLNYDTNAALTQIQAKVAQVRNDLPPEAEAPVIELETADTQFAAMYIGFSSADLDQNQITDYLTRVVQPKLSAVSGVQRADILGDRTFAMRVWLKPDRMAAHGISPSELRDALAQNNYLSALGRTKGSMVSVNLVANTDLRTAEEFRQLVVKEQQGTVVRLGEVADVVLGAETYEDDVRFNGQSATFMGVWVLPTANTLDVIKSVREEIPAIQSQLPAGMTVGIPYDSTEYIQDAIDEVLTTLSETLLIVIAVIFLFLGSVRALLIPVVAIPISLVGAVFLMLVAGFTINLLTLLAIVLSVGLVVDDAIVMVENVERHLQEGKQAFRAAIDAARELIGPIIAMTITLAAVYAPVGIQGGLTGALFREFAFTLAAAVIVSGVVALTLSPMMASRMLRAGDSERGFSGWINRRFDSLRHAYTRGLTSTLNYRPVVLVLWALVTLLMVPFYMFSQRELAPDEDQGVVFGIVQAAANSTVDQTKLFTQQVYEVYKSFPEAGSIFQITSPTAGFGGMVTKPWSERTKTTQQLLMESMGPLSQIPGIRVIPLTPPPLPGGGDFPVDLVIASAAEPQQLQEFAQQLVQKAFASGMFMFADADVKFDQPQTEVVFDRDKLRSQGVDLGQAGRDLSALLGGDYVNRFSIQGRSYKVIPQIKRAERLTPDQLSDIYITGSANAGVWRIRPESGERRGIGKSARSAVDIRDPAHDDRAARAEEVSAAQCRADSGRHSAAGATRPGVDLPRGGGQEDPAAGLQHRLRRRVTSASRGRQPIPRRVPALGGADLSRAGRTVRELPGSLHHSRGVRAARGLGRVALLVPRTDDAQHLQPGRADHAGRPGGQERNPDRAVCEPPSGNREGQTASRDRSVVDAPAADSDDDGRHRGRAHAADSRDRSGSGRTEQHRHHARDRNDHRHGVHPVRGALDLRARGPDPGGDH